MRVQVTDLGWLVSKVNVQPGRVLSSGKPSIYIIPFLSILPWSWDPENPGLISGFSPASGDAGYEAGLCG